MSVVKSVLTGAAGTDSATPANYIAADGWPWLQEGTPDLLIAF